MKVGRNKTSGEKRRPAVLNRINSRSIYPDNEFREILNYERIRTDRNGSVFSITLFSSNDLYKNKKNLNCFIDELSSQIRLIDHAGWYDKDFIAVGKKITGNLDFVDNSTPAFTVYTYPQNWLEHGVHTVPYAGNSVKKHGELNLRNYVEGIFTRKMPVWKRILDITGSIFGLIVASPIFFILSIYIKLVSPGPVFFKQKRVGFKGEMFNFWKFRTMKYGNNQEFHGKHSQSFIKNGDIPMEKLDDHDPRIFYGGRVIRKSCIDELPQLWNILKGDMSLVGPRPCIPYEAEEYLRWHTHRFDVVPGLTGLWQVSGKNKLTFKQMIRLDINYSKHLSLLNDLIIISITPFAILKMVGDSVLKKLTGSHAEEEREKTMHVINKSGSV